MNVDSELNLTYDIHRAGLQLPANIRICMFHSVRYWCTFHGSDTDCWNTAPLPQHPHIELLSERYNADCHYTLA